MTHNKVFLNENIVLLIFVNMINNCFENKNFFPFLKPDKKG